MDAVDRMGIRRSVDAAALFSELHAVVHGVACTCDPRVDLSRWARWRDFVTRHVAKAVRRKTALDRMPAFDFDAMRMYAMWTRILL